MKKNYTVQTDKDGNITSFSFVDNNNQPVEKIKLLIIGWNKAKKDTTYELIEDEKTIKILDYLHRFEDNEDMENKLRRYENLFEDMQNLLGRW